MSLITFNFTFIIKFAQEKKKRIKKTKEISSQYNSLYITTATFSHEFKVILDPSKLLEELCILSIQKEKIDRVPVVTILI